jgi:hypothetical protein
LVFALVGASPVYAQQACVLTKEKAARLHAGISLQAIEHTLNCKLIQQTSEGIGDTARDLYATQDDAGNRIFVLLGKGGRLVRVNFIPRQLNPPDPLKAPPPQQPPRWRIVR